MGTIYEIRKSKPMRIYLAATSAIKSKFLDGTIKPEEIYVLESFYSLQDWQKPLINRFKSFLLDSGAFTFLNGVKSPKKADFERYADMYADFIKENQVKYYFELDIDGIVGLKEVEKLRNRIEQRSGVPCIPVWHKNRGKEYFISMCKDYKYVSVGGIVTKEIATSLYERMFPWFINTAHQYGTKIHGLGYTKLKELGKYRFDSVDSTTWTMGNRVGAAMLFKNGTIVRKDSDEKKRLKEGVEIQTHNFMEWIKFQKYADNNL